MRIVSERVVGEVHEVEVKEATLEFACAVVKQKVAEEGGAGRGGGAKVKMEKSKLLGHRAGEDVRNGVCVLVTEGAGGGLLETCV